MDEITPAYTKAVELNRKIITNAQIAQQSVYEMCVGLKTMRDEKLFEVLGYNSFENYCESEVGIKRVQAHKYISIIENLPAEFVSPVKQNGNLGMRKLYLLSTLSEEDQSKITAENDIENTSCRQLEKEISRLKEERQALLNEKDDLNELITGGEQAIENLKAENKNLTSKMENLENKPIIADENGNAITNARQLTIMLNKIDLKNQEQYDEMVAQFEKHERELYQEIRDLEAQLKNKKEGQAEADPLPIEFNVHMKIFEKDFITLAKLVCNNTALKTNVERAINQFNKTMEGI